jgi:hypothetical protein
MEEELIQEMVKLNDQELLQWLLSLVEYGELPEQTYVVYLESLHRGGETAKKAQQIYKNM